MDNAGNVRVSIDDRGVAIVELTRPRAGNAITLEMAQELGRAAEKVAGARVVVLRAAGRFFCVGGDLPSFAAAEGTAAAKGTAVAEPAVGKAAADELAAAEETAARVAATAQALHVAVRAFAAGDAPVIARVQGVAAGAGLSLVAGADVVVASEQAAFVFAYAAAGLSPDGGASWFLPRRIGAQRAFELALTNRRLDAATARQWGLVTRVVDGEQLDDAVQEYADAALRSSTGSLGAVKRLLAASTAASLDGQLDSEVAELAARAGSPDGREGIAAVVARRRPVFPAN
ncbi:enoyl-CoA hydratase-related protein [Actinoplanes sp. NBRC 101535]|uniref:enoyl-CoA hydratase/isomerase family protein n=1 Tax=Actinoplanes sp. NBRC 101535 TaxID=3032196 RepID=UPI0024A0BEFB|nr:enoyl-CoA hydratase-related protein [Actinoplanes sp. NBRC 101535]GLY03073.1 enoyl-CoA hydratase [Actinoplanes sp. NBRC 101535]